jgi:type VI secretion system secreted protein Hcp
MKTNHFYHFALLIFLCQFATLFASAQANPPVIGYVTIQGAKTGQFRGNSVSEGNEGKIECIGFRYSVSVAHDAESGKPNGKRQHSPIVIVKNIDYSTPQLLQAAYDNEDLKTVVIEFYKRSSTGQSTLSYKVTLTNASISLISQYGGTASPDNNGNAVNNSNLAEEITLTFQNIVFENLVGNTSAVDNWRR